MLHNDSVYDTCQVLRLMGTLPGETTPPFSFLPPFSMSQLLRNKFFKEQSPTYKSRFHILGMQVKWGRGSDYLVQGNQTVKLEITVVSLGKNEGKTWSMDTSYMIDVFSTNIYGYILHDQHVFHKYSNILGETVLMQTWAQGYKTFFMLNSAGHEILNAHKYKNMKKLSIFQAQISQECYFSCS